MHFHDVIDLLRYYSNGNNVLVIAAIIRPGFSSSRVSMACAALMSLSAPPAPVALRVRRRPAPCPAAP